MLVGLLRGTTYANVLWYYPSVFPLSEVPVCCASAATFAWCVRRRVYSISSEVCRAVPRLPAVHSRCCISADAKYVQQRATAHMWVVGMTSAHRGATPEQASKLHARRLEFPGCFRSREEVVAFLNAAHAINPVLPVTCGPDVRLPHNVCPPAAFAVQSADAAAPTAPPPEQMPKGLRRSTRRRARATIHDHRADSVQDRPRGSLDIAQGGAGQGGGVGSPQRQVPRDDSAGSVSHGQPASPKRQRLVTPRRSPRGHLRRSAQGSEDKTDSGVARPAPVWSPDSAMNSFFALVPAEGDSFTRARADSNTGSHSGSQGTDSGRTGRDSGFSEGFPDTAVVPGDELVAADFDESTLKALAAETHWHAVGTVARGHSWSAHRAE